MSYFGGASSAAGDPGLFGTLGKLGAALGRNLPIVGAGIRTLEAFQRPTGGTRPPAVPRIPTISTGAATTILGMDGMRRRKRRRMNPGNTKALKKAVKRVDRFVDLAKTSLKDTGWTVVSKSSLASTRQKAKEHPHHRHRR